MNPEITVIVPVYNVERYVEKCLDSLYHQTFKDFEVVIVDDCGTDRSLDLVMLFAQRRPEINIKIIKQQQNGGLSKARNEALRQAKGRFITFLDSDDFLDIHALEIFYSAAKVTDADIVCSGLMFKYKNNDIPSINGKEAVIYGKEEALSQLLITYKISTTACGKFFKRDLFVYNNVEFPEGIYFEDIPTIVQLINLSKAVYCLPNYLYNYVQEREDSIMSEVKLKSVTDSIAVDLLFSRILPRLTLRNQQDLLGYRFDFLYRAYRWLKELDATREDRNYLNNTIKNALYPTFKALIARKIDLKKVIKYTKVALRL